MAFSSGLVALPSQIALLTQVASGTISTADFSTLASIGKLILPSPGAGFALLPISFSLNVTYAGAAPTGGGLSNLQWANTTLNAGAAASTSMGNILAVYTANTFVTSTLSSGVNYSTNIANMPLYLGMHTGDYTMGACTSTATWNLVYMTLRTV